jgi:O-antigen ligase
MKITDEQIQKFTTIVLLIMTLATAFVLICVGIVFFKENLQGINIMTLTIIITVYLSGFICSYYMLKHYIILTENDWDWGYIKVCIGLSLLFSWLPFLFILIKKLKEKLPPNPPKWL